TGQHRQSDARDRCSGQEARRAGQEAGREGEGIRKRDQGQFWREGPIDSGQCELFAACAMHASTVAFDGDLDDTRVYDPDGASDFDDPPWEAIEKAIRELDGRFRTQIVLRT